MKESNLINNSNQNNNNNNNGIEIKPIKEKKTIHGEFFVALASILFFYVGYIFLFQQITPFQLSSFFIDIFYIFIYIMMFWAYIIVMRSPPGSIPLYWGFYIGDDDEKRKRYCLICNAFKPERSKHCSICNECILNMDHHCPWVNNCIGFFNRKYFMQFIFYVEISFIYNFVASLIYLIKKFEYIKKEKIGYLHYGFLWANCLAVGIASFLFGKFVIYHINLVLKNSSTIENLDKENQDKYAKFCLTPKENFEQVFGKNKLYWFLPINTEEGKPDGDGLLWKVNNNEQNV